MPARSPRPHVAHVPRRLRRLVAPLLLLVPFVAAPSAAPPRALKVVELYQSQGCSSCPPAIANVNALADRPDLLVLDFAVTYWDALGWKDSFADPGYTKRQWDYAHGGHRAQVFTPQVIVNGRAVGVGGDGRALGGLVAGQQPLAGPAIGGDGGHVEIGAAPWHGPMQDVWLVRYDPRALPVAIGRGENAGRTLIHRNIVRRLARLGGWSGAALRLALPPATPALATAVLVQAPGGGAILAAAKVG